MIRRLLAVGALAFAPIMPQCGGGTSRPTGCVATHYGYDKFASATCTGGSGTFRVVGNVREADGDVVTERGSLVYVGQTSRMFVGALETILYVWVET